MGKGTFYAPFVVGAGPGVGKLFMQNLRGQAPPADLPDLVAPDSTGQHHKIIYALLCWWSNSNRCGFPGAQAGAIAVSSTALKACHGMALKSELVVVGQLYPGRNAVWRPERPLQAECLPHSADIVLREIPFHGAVLAGGLVDHVRAGGCMVAGRGVLPIRLARFHGIEEMVKVR